MGTKDVSYWPPDRNAWWSGRSWRSLTSYFSNRFNTFDLVNPKKKWFSRRASIHSQDFVFECNNLQCLQFVIETEESVELVRLHGFNRNWEAETRHAEVSDILQTTWFVCYTYTRYSLRLYLNIITFQRSWNASE